MKIIQLAGATAKQGGMTLEELVSMGAVISENTRLAAETIGTSLTTIIQISTSRFFNWRN